MNKLLIASTIAIATLTTPALTTSALAKGDCAAMLTKLDTAIEASKAADETKMKALEMREQAAQKQAAGDEKACAAATTAALEVLAK